MDPLNQTINRQDPRELLEDPEIRSFLSRVESQVNSFQRYSIDLSGTYSINLQEIAKVTVNLYKRRSIPSLEGEKTGATVTVSQENDSSSKVKKVTEEFLSRKGFDIGRTD